MSIGSISFSGVQKTTAAGNPYKKTNVGKIAGTAVGGSLGAAGIAIINKAFKNPTFMEKLKEAYGEFAPVIKDAYKKASVKGALIFTAAGLALGAIIDLCVNKHRQNKADKEAAMTEAFKY